MDFVQLRKVVFLDAFFLNVKALQIKKQQKENASDLPSISIFLLLFLPSSTTPVFTLQRTQRSRECGPIATLSAVPK